LLQQGDAALSFYSFHGDVPPKEAGALRPLEP